MILGRFRTDALGPWIETILSARWPCDQVWLIGSLRNTFEVEINVIESQMRSAVQANLNLHLIVWFDPNRLVFENLEERVLVAQGIIVENHALSAHREYLFQLMGF